MSESILDSIKKLLGIEAEYTQFDQDITLHINSIFAVLYQVGGIDQSAVFSITSKEETWDQAIKGQDQINMVKSYMYARVRLLFDPPQTSFGIEALKEQAKELEVRLNYLEDLFVIPEPV